MPKIDSLTLHVMNPDAQRAYYRDVLGMADFGGGKMGYSEAEAALDFQQANAPYSPQRSDLYWKIAISVPNIELAHKQLSAAGHPCTEPHQFRDVGYLAKLTDPEGFTVELIDHWFAGERSATETIDTTKLGGGPHLSLVTLRTADMAQLEPQILSLGMRPVSEQPVTPHGFTLHFYTFNQDLPPDPDLTAIRNRPWVYQRPETVLEFQEVDAMDSVTLPEDGAAGYGRLSITGAEPATSIESLRIEATT